MGFTRKQYTWATLIVVILLIIFLYYYFKNKTNKEKCPDGRDIPDSANCADNPPLKDTAGNSIPPQPAKPDANGCISPDKYILNFFPLALGMHGALVKELQVGLNNAFHSKLSTDGYFGCKTLAALKSALNIETIDAQTYKDKILTPNTFTLPEQNG